MNPIDVKAKSLDEAITKAMLELGTTSDNIEYEVIDKGSSGFLGIGAKPVVIRAKLKKETTLDDIDLGIKAPGKKKNKKPVDRAKAENSPEKKADAGKAKQEAPKAKAEAKHESKPANKPARSEAKPASKAEAALAVKEEAVKPEKTEAKPKVKEIVPVDVTPYFPKADEFLKEVFKAMDMEVTTDIKASEEPNTIEIDLEGDDMGVLIGKRGQTLDALQYLTSIVINAENSDYIRVKVDTENYRYRRKQTLENLAENLASKVKRTGKAVTLEPINAYERRIIHSILQQNKYVNTHSEGEEPYRKVVITPEKGVRPYNNKRKNNYRRKNNSHNSHKDA